MSPFSDLVGKRVIVIWTDAAFRDGSDWIAYRLIDARKYGVTLQGVSSPDGSKHHGDQFNASNSEIRDIIEWRKEP